jgi:hypothetical protein
MALEAVGINSIHGQDLGVLPEPGIQNVQIPLNTRPDNIVQPNFSPVTAEKLLPKSGTVFQRSINETIRACEPDPYMEVPPPAPEPAPFSTTAEEWTKWIHTRDAYETYKTKRDSARAFAAKNDLPGTF